MRRVDRRAIEVFSATRPALGAGFVGMFGVWHAPINRLMG